MAARDTTISADSGGAAPTDPTTSAGVVTAGQRHRSALAVTLALQVGVMVIQIVGAFISGSMALLADSGHMLTDSVGVALALGATWLAARPATARRTFGLQRIEILAALVNAMLLVAVCVAILIGGIDRTIHPGEIEAGPMLVFAVIGCLANLIGVMALRRGKDESVNVRGAYLEVFGDLLGSVAVIAAAIVVGLTGFERADGIASLLIAGLILPRAFSLLRDVVNVLLESTPDDIDLTEVRNHILTMPDVVEVHDLHAWTITSGVPVLSAHVIVGADALRERGSRAMLDRLHECLAGHFDVAHCTFQIEPNDQGVQETTPHP